MSISPEELALYNDWERLRSAFVAAKERVAAGELDRNSDEYQAVKRAMDEARTTWRQIGEYVGTRNPVTPIAATLEVVE